MEPKKKINELDLFRYMNHELSGRESIEVEEWIHASEENRKIAKDYYELSFAVTSLQLIKRSAPQKALKKVHKKIKEKHFRKFYLHVQRAAVILLLPLLVLSGFLLLGPGKQMPVFYLEARMTPGMTGSTLLPDGTKVWLNSSSYLKYPSSFSGPTREVSLDGEAYFQVAENREIPFIVHTGSSSVKVLGTEFNMDAYSSNGFIATTLVSGSIQFNYQNEDHLSRTVILKPSERIYYDKKTSRTEIGEAYVPKDIAWKNGQIILKETPLSEILWMLSKRFNVEFTIKDPAFYNYSFTGVFTNQQIERVLEHFKRSSGIRYKINHELDPGGEIARSRIELY